MTAIYSTLTELLQERKKLTGTGVTFIEAGAKEVVLPYSELYDSAISALSFLQSQGLRPKDELVFQIEDNRTFVIVFWACILGGIVPVPLAIGRNDDHKQKLFNIWPLLKNPFLIISSDNLFQMGAFAQQQGLESLFAVIGKKMINEADLFSSNGYGEIYKADENDIAFVQFSSGSTGAPKGVMLTHKNLLTNVRAISAAANYSKEDSMLSWMPLTHDMGLIGFHINPLFSAMDHYLMPPALFVRRPSLWLDKATGHKATILCAPNFGYEYLMRHCNVVSGQYDWDLRSVRLLYNGAEPISESICRNFLHQLSKYGLKSNAMCPVYGLAEASLAVSISGLDNEVESLALSRNQLQTGARIRLIATGEEHSATFVNVGEPINDCLLRIADEDNKEMSEEIIGYIQIKGDNVAAGYYNNASATQQTITEDGWLKTGDLGFLRNGCLYITGRAKDILFSNGENYYAHDIERIAQEIEGIELNKVVVAGGHNNEWGKEEIVLFILHRGKIEDFSQMATSAKLLINQKAGLLIDRVIPVKEIPRTTSGKLQRFRLLEAYKNGDFDDVLRQLDQLTIPIRPQPHSIPEPEYEQRLLEIWKIILKTMEIGIDQHFFSIGGNSLRAAEMTMLVLKEFQVDLPVETIYNIPTIRQLAASISALRKQEYIPIPVADKADRYPLSATQKRLYYFQQTNPSSTAYNIPVAIKITGEIDPALLESCIQQLIIRYDSLRTIFPASVEPAFHVLEPALVSDKFLFTLARTEYRDVDLKDLLKQLVRPFNVATAPLFRANLIEKGHNEYILFLDFHHLIADGISVAHFIRELFLLYRGIALSPLPVQYKDYAASEKEHLQSERIKKQEAYWMQQLQGELPVLELPADFQRPLIFDAGGRKLTFEPDKALLEKLRQLATRHECSLHVLLFTLYNILLYKYTGQQDLIIGIPVAGRRHPDVRQVLGMFVNNLAIRSTTTGDQTFAQLLSDKKNTIAEAFAHQDYPFDHVIQAVQQKRDVGRNPVFDTMFVYQNMGFPAVETPGSLTVSSYPFDPGFSKFDLSLEIFEEAHTLTFAFEYASALFKEETIAAMARHFEVLMQQATEHPNSPVSQLSLISDKEYEEYIHAFNATDAPYPADKTIHQLFDEQVKRTSDNIAIVDGPEKISYQQLQERANHLADILKQKGIGPGSIVAILLFRSPAMIVSMLAVLKAGGAYLPIETDLPVARIKLLIDNSRCSILLAGDGTTGLAVAAGQGSGIGSLAVPEIINVDKLDVTHASGLIVQLPANPQDAAYVIYTSGTTGLPKGVVIEHRSLVNYIHWAAKSYLKKEKGDFPLYTSISFDLTVTSIFVPLVTGNSIIIYKEEAPGSLIELVVTDNRVDIIKTTPSHLKILLQSKVAAFLPGSRINTIIVGGEKLETALALEIYNAFNGNVAIYNEYGPTEATVGCMIHLFSPLEMQRAVPIGVPAANTRIYVLDKYLQPVPTGVHGEIYIAGNGLARAYLFNESMTAEKFIPDPFRKGEKMYKTGDIAKWLPNGVIEYIGRSDLQVKINGYRIELSEIENALNGFPEISASLVTVRINPKNKQILSAFYISTGKLTESALRDYLADRLPYYMIPVHVTRIERIPLTRNGKIDYNALPEPEGKEKSNHELPVSEIEAICLNVWEEVLGLTDLHVDDNFFELGGDSIKAVQISFRLTDHGISISAKDILTYQVIRSISLHAKMTAKGNTYEQGLVQGERSLLPIEAWFITRNFDNPDYYNQSVLLTLNRPINREWLQLAFKNIVRHHDGLRLNYDPEKRKLWYNNNHLDDAFIIGELEEDLVTVCHRVKSSFDIRNGLLLKAALIKENSSLFGKLLITAHHLVMDGISWRILLEDLYAVYHAIERGAPVRLPSKTASSIEWEKRLVEYAGTPAVLAEQPYWNKIENSEFDIPTDFRTHDWRMINIGIVKGSLNKETTGFLLKGAHQAYNTDILILLNAALAGMLKEWTGMARFIIELENHGRYLDTVDTSRTIGWFTGMYPVELSCPEGNPGELIKAVKEQIRNTPAHGIGYGIWKYLAPGNRTKAQDVSITAIRFNYLGQFDSELNNDLFSYSTESSGSDADSRNKITAKLEFNLMIISEVLYVDIKYNTKAYKESTIEWIRETFLKKIHALLTHLQNETSLHFTPSDFEIDINQQELDALFK